MAQLMLNRVWKLLAQEDGPTAVEYAVIVMLIFLAVISTVQILGLSLAASFQDSGDQIQTALFND